MQVLIYFSEMCKMSKVEGLILHDIQILRAQIHLILFLKQKVFLYSDLSKFVSTVKFAVHYGGNSDCESKSLVPDVASCGCNVSLFFG